MKRKIEFAMGILIVAAAIFLAKTGFKLMSEAKDDPKCIVIDAGHGNWDPGKVGVSGSKEKDVNLIIANKLKDLLESADYKVIMTRSDDQSLSSGLVAQTKAEDMRERCEIIEAAKPEFTISVHQNSYTSPEIKGAQVFYYDHSDGGRELAKILQDSLVSRIDPKNTRVEKSNESYYLLRKTSSPTIIVECGFMSNPEEEKLLNQDSYQEKLAWAIFMGINVYLNTD